MQKLIARIACMVALVIVGAGLGAIPAQAVTQAESSDLEAAIITADPTKSVLQLKNVSDKSCQVATTAQGTVAITRVVQNNAVVQPVPTDAITGSDDDIGYVLQSQLKTLKPGESINIQLATYKVRSGQLLRATTWSAGAGNFSTEYPIATDKSLRLEANYSLPITPAEGAPACGPVFASMLTDSRSLWQHPVFLIGLLLLLILLIVLIVVLVRRKKHKHKHIGKASAALLCMIGVGVWWQQTPAVQAQVTVPPSMQADFDACMATLNANRDITGPVLDAINNPANQVEIVYTSGGSETTGRRTDGGGSFRIYWNPDDRHMYAGTGGRADPCTSLYHEMYHILDMANGTFSRDDCAGSGIETKEVMATRAQNLLIQRLGGAPRSHYGDRPLPSGDCTASANPAQCTGEHCGETNGDPHLRTFDGLRYDFQAAGEFTAVRNKSGVFEIQVRQEPWTDSRQVTINTAVAFRVSGERIEIQAGRSLAILHNGKKVTLKATALPGGGSITIDQNVIVVSWPDGSKAYVRSVGDYGVALSVQPSADLVSTLEGLLGDADGDSKNDLRVRNSKGAIQPEYKQLYPDFADSWRITAKASLFTYAKGKTTDSYTDRTMPDKPVDPKTLPGYKAAESFCKSLGISDPVVLANCALDMAITGRPEFARAAVYSQAFAAGADFGGTTWQLDIAKPGDKAQVTFDAKAGEKIFVAIVRTTLPSQCGLLRLLGPDGKEVASGCIINGKGEIDGVVLPQAGTHTLVLAPDGAVGNTTAQLLRIADKQGAITPDGREVGVRIDKPGVVGRYTFSGTAGQHIYVDVPSSSLVSECGLLRLLGPDGRQLAGGCIINGVGNIDTAQLPADGQYAVVVDPSNTQVGQVNMRVVRATAEAKPIVVNGPSLVAKLTKPGSTALFTFDGRAGQRIFVDIPRSDLPSQCGLLRLRNPDASIEGSGCVINRKGDLNGEGTVLQMNGKYTIILDPQDNATGTTTIRVRDK